MVAIFDVRLAGSLKGERQIRPELSRVDYNDRIQRLRLSEYPMLRGVTYLDHGGTTLACKSLLDTFAQEMQQKLLSNPHSDAIYPSLSAVTIKETRRMVLTLFKADPDHFDVIFTANATAAVKLVAECFAGHKDGFEYLYHRNCHTSLVGVREIAKQACCLGSDDETERWIKDGSTDEKSRATRPTLFAYPAQSNMDGQRLPLSWPSAIRTSLYHPNTFTLLDAAALVSTSPLDLSDPDNAADFTVMSFYKIFGFPDLGALIVRTASANVLSQRRYFGGGTTELITMFEEPWVARKQGELHERLEDGTLAIRNVLALKCAIETHERIFGGLEYVSKHTSWLAALLYDRLSTIRHANDTPVFQVYKAPTSTYGDSKTQGATIAFNIRKSDGSLRGPYSVGSTLRSHGIHVRTGGLCNPGGVASALDLSPTDLRQAWDSGFRCNEQDDTREDNRIFGVVRVTFGAMSVLEDIEHFLRVAAHELVDRDAPDQALPDSTCTTVNLQSQRARSYISLRSRGLKRESELQRQTRERARLPWLKGLFHSGTEFSSSKR